MPTLNPRVSVFEAATGLCPLIQADLAVGEVEDYLQRELPAHLAEALERRAHRTFARNPSWRRRVMGARGREAFRVFLRHWLASLLGKEMPEIARQLPESFALGRPLARRTELTTAA
jgi:hypothetical protein